MTDADRRVELVPELRALVSARLQADEDDWSDVERIIVDRDALGVWLKPEARGGHRIAYRVEFGRGTMR